MIEHKISLRPHQIPPADPNWTQWLIAGDRDTGKTFAAAHEVAKLIVEGLARKVALVGHNRLFVDRQMWSAPSGILGHLHDDETHMSRQPAADGAYCLGDCRLHVVTVDNWRYNLPGRRFDLIWCDEVDRAANQEMMDYLRYRLDVSGRFVISEKG